MGSSESWVGPEKYGKCSGRTANAGGISWRYAGEGRTMHSLRFHEPDRSLVAHCIHQRIDAECITDAREMVEVQAAIALPLERIAEIRVVSH
jgi:hypothetical protein